MTYTCFVVCLSTIMKNKILIFAWVVLPVFLFADSVFAQGADNMLSARFTLAGKATFTSLQNNAKKIQENSKKSDFD